MQVAGAGHARPQAHHQREPEIGNERERMGGIDRERRQHREDLAPEVVGQPVMLARRELVGVDHVHVGRRQFGAQLSPASLLFGHELGGGGIDLNQGFGRRPSIRRPPIHAGGNLAHQRRHPDHVELVEVRARDREEVHALQQRVMRLAGFAEDTPVERDPGQFPVHEPVRAEPDCRKRALLRLRSPCP